MTTKTNLIWELIHDARRNADECRYKAVDTPEIDDMLFWYEQADAWLEQASRLLRCFA